MMGNKAIEKSRKPEFSGNINEINSVETAETDQTFWIGEEINTVLVSQSWLDRLGDGSTWICRESLKA